MRYAGKYHDSKAIIEESKIVSFTLIVTLPEGNALLGYSRDSQFYCDIASEAVTKGWLTVNDPESPLVRRGMKVTPKPVVEQIYLVCVECGETFDEIVTAHEHLEDCDPDATFLTKPESEAF